MCFVNTCALWMLEVSGIQSRKSEHCQQMIENLAGLTNITDFHVAQIHVLHKTSTRENASIIILFNKRWQNELLQKTP